VPVPAWVKNVIDEWLAAAKITEGRIFRSISKGGRLQGETLAEMAVWWLVKGYAEGIGVKNLAPHDLRRYAAWKNMPSRPAYALWFADFLFDDSA
jgi:integrase/recombinase XerD